MFHSAEITSPVTIRKVLLTWAGEDFTILPENLDDIIKHFDYLPKGLQKILSGLFTKYFFNQKNVEFSHAELNQDYQCLMGLIQIYPEIRKPYRDIFKEQVVLFFKTVEQCLEDLTKNIKSKEAKNSKMPNDFLEFSCQFTGLQLLQENIADNQNVDEIILDAFSVLNNCVHENKELFSSLINKADLLRAHINLNKMFSYSKIRSKKSNLVGSNYTNGDILSGQLNFLIRVILGDYFISSGIIGPLLPQLLKTKSKLFGFLSKSEEAEISPAVIEYIVPKGLNPAIEAYKQDYIRNAWRGLKNYLCLCFKINSILENFKNTWVDLIKKESVIKLGEKADSEEINHFFEKRYNFVDGIIFEKIKKDILKSKEFTDLKSSDKNTADKISTVNNLHQLTEFVKPDEMEGEAPKKQYKNSIFFKPDPRHILNETLQFLILAQQEELLMLYPRRYLPLPNGTSPKC